MTKLTIEKYHKLIDIEIADLKRKKQWYLDYRCGSGMTPMLEEFSQIIDIMINKLKTLKTMSNTIDPHSLLGRSP